MISNKTIKIWAEIDRMIKSRLFFIVAVLLVIMATGCVTTEKGGFEKAKTVDAAVSIRVNAAKQYLQKRDFESAKRHLKIALELDPDSPSVHDALALTFHASGELDLAEIHYRKAVHLSDGQSRFRVNYANYLFQQGEFEQAERQLLVVADDSLYEKRESALLLLGFTQQQLLQLANAKESFERALVLNPSNRRVLRELAILSYDAREYTEAWYYLQQYRKYTSKPSAEMLLLGVELAGQRNDADARSSFVLALKNIYPESREYKSYLRDTERKQSAE